MTEPWSDVQTRGYAVVRSFLSEAECRELVAEFDTLSEPSEILNPNYRGLRYLSLGTKTRFAPKLIAAAKQASSPSLVMDRVRNAIYYATRLGHEPDWHTDTTSYYLHPDFLNFWIPLVKPVASRTGLSVVGYDALAARHPELAAHFVGRGSARVVVRNGVTVIHDHDRLATFELPEPDALDALAVAPELAPGDLLVLRSDVFHRTQDTQTDRLAISFRVISSRAIVTRERLMTMGASKFNNMARMRTHFARRFATFEIAGQPALTVAEYDAIYFQLARREAALCSQLGVEALSNTQFDDLVYEFTVEYARRPRARP